MLETTQNKNAPSTIAIPSPSLPVEKSVDDGRFMRLNLGPSHPATHGTLRIFVGLEGELIREMKLEIGYLHRCFEKMAETHTWNQVIPFTDRLNYVSAMMNNVGYVKAVEKLLGIEVPKRCQRIRVIMSEL